MLDNLIPIMAVGLPLSIPIIAILTHHQRKMAEIYAGRNQADSTQLHAEVARLREEVRELRATVHEQMIALDGVSQLTSSTPPPADHLSRRLQN